HHVSRHVGFGDDVEPETAIAESMDMTAFEGAGYKRPLCMRHPDMCDLLNRAAKEAGADLRRGIHDLQVTSGERPEVRFTQNGAASLLRPRLVIGADGRNSVVRGQVAIPVHRDPTHHLMTGMLVDDVDGWPDSMQVIGSEGDVNFLVFPQSKSRARLYLCYGLEQKRRFVGPDNQARFLEAFQLKCLPHSEYLLKGTPSGPCNSYGNEDAWTTSPVVPGLVLIGDAAGHNDPIIGQGLSISYRDVRIVRDLMVENRDWKPELFAAYVEERAERMRRLRLVALLVSILSAEFGENARARRIRFRSERIRNTIFDLLPAAFLGPELLPAEAFSEDLLDRVRAL